MELLATTGDAFVRVGAHTRLQGSGAQCLALDGDTVYVGCRGGGESWDELGERVGRIAALAVSGPAPSAGPGSR